MLEHRSAQSLSGSCYADMVFLFFKRLSLTSIMFFHLEKKLQFRRMNRRSSRQLRPCQGVEPTKRRKANANFVSGAV